MIESCRSCLHLFNANWISEKQGALKISEDNPTGKGEARFESAKPCILVKADKQAPLLWALSQRKCADGAIISFDEDGAHFHLIELKGKIKLSTWAYMLEQFEGMFLTSIAVARLLEIQRPIKVTCYTAGTEDRVSQSQSASPTLLKAPVGKARTFGDWEAWNSALINLPYSIEAKLVKGWKDPNGIADFGVI